jgi:hypothetical protein
MDEGLPDAPTGDPERAERERESREDVDTKYEQQRDIEEAERDELADDLTDEQLTRRDD